jgi:hypothetical protein
MPVRYYIEAFLDVWYNFTGPHRPRTPLWLLVGLGIFCILNATISSLSLGHGFALIMFLVGVILWFGVLPTVFFLIDEKNGHAKIRPNSPWKR